MVIDECKDYHHLENALAVRWMSDKSLRLPGNGFELWARFVWGFDKYEVGFPGKATSKRYIHVIKVKLIDRDAIEHQQSIEMIQKMFLSFESKPDRSPIEG